PRDAPLSPTRRSSDLGSAAASDGSPGALAGASGAGSSAAPSLASASGAAPAGALSIFMPGRSLPVPSTTIRSPLARPDSTSAKRSEEHTSELQSRENL